MTDFQTIVLGMGCFWGAEKRMAALPGVIDVESGYANGDVAGSYDAVLAHERLVKAGKTSQRNHAEVVKVCFDPAQVNLDTVLRRFWESHNPTQVNRQGNDIGTNYRSAIYTSDAMQQAVALKTRDIYQTALTQQGFGTISTEIAPLRNYFTAEDYHQDYLEKNPHGYCGLGGTGVNYPATATVSNPDDNALDPTELNHARQLIVFETSGCQRCQQFSRDILDNWQAEIPMARTSSTQAPTSWQLSAVIATWPTAVLFENGQEVSRFTDDSAKHAAFWAWLGKHLLSPEQQRIAFEHGTERPGTGAHLDEKRAGTFLDPVTGVALFRSNTKFDSGSGWPSFFDPLPGALSEHVDQSFGMRRVEVRSASSGIHLGHVFDDGPRPSGKRYCINGNVLKFVPDNA